MTDELKVHDLADVLAQPDEPGDWGPWRLDPELRVLYPVWPYRYEVDLDTCMSSAEVLDWIIQIAGKGWAGSTLNADDNPDGWTDDAVVAGLVRALDDVLQPQAYLCSSGRSKRLSKRKIAELVQEAVEDGRVRT